MKVVVIMPFAKEFDPVFTTIREAVKEIDPRWRCIRMDRDRTPGDIIDKIRLHISTATICIADITGINANVMWEIGYAHALNKPTITISQSTENLPFDIYHFNVLKYGIDGQPELMRQLKRALESTQRQLEAHINQHVIAVAGSHSVDQHKARKAFERIATPYLGRGITWYCGARDPMQQEILGFLLDKYERIVVINQQSHAIDSTLSKRLTRHSAIILDPTQELATRDRSSALDLIPGFNAMFTLYARRSECIFLLWDGQSVKTREFQQWLAENGKQYLLTRV